MTGIYDDEGGKLPTVTERKLSMPGEKIAGEVVDIFTTFANSAKQKNMEVICEFEKAKSSAKCTIFSGLTAARGVKEQCASRQTEIVPGVFVLVGASFIGNLVARRKFNTGIRMVKRIIYPMMGFCVASSLFYPNMTDRMFSEARNKVESYVEELKILDKIQEYKTSMINSLENQTQDKKNMFKIQINDSITSLRNKANTNLGFNDNGSGQDKK